MNWRRWRRNCNPNKILEMLSIAEAMMCMFEQLCIPFIRDFIQKNNVSYMGDEERFFNERFSRDEIR